MFIPAVSPTRFVVIRISRGDPPSAANERPRARSRTVAAPLASTVRPATTRSQVGAPAEGELLGAGPRQPGAQQRVVAVGDRHPARREEQSRLFVGDRRERAELLGVLEIDVDHHGDGRTRDPAELGDLARNARSALEHDRPVLRGEGEEGHRHADPVVQVPGRHQGLAEECPHRRGGERLGRGLAGGAADREDGERAAAGLAIDEMPGEVAQRHQRVGNLDARPAPSCRSAGSGTSRHEVHAPFARVSGVNRWPS